MKIKVKRAALMRRADKKRSVTVGDEHEADDDFTQRVLMSLVVDITCLAENVERVKVQVFAMAKENGVHIPSTEED